MKKVLPNVLVIAEVLNLQLWRFISLVINSLTMMKYHDEIPLIEEIQRLLKFHNYNCAQTEDSLVFTYLKHKWLKQDFVILGKKWTEVWVLFGPAELCLLNWYQTHGLELRPHGSWMTSQSCAGLISDWYMQQIHVAHVISLPSNIQWYSHMLDYLIEWVQVDIALMLAGNEFLMFVWLFLCSICLMLCVYIYQFFKCSLSFTEAWINWIVSLC